MRFRLPFSLKQIKIRRAQRRTDAEWMALLQSNAPDQALEELRVILLHGLQGALKSKIPQTHHYIIEDFVQEGLIKIVGNLSTFRGESRFLTWCQKICLRIAFAELRRKHWQNSSLTELLNNNRSGVQIPDTTATPDDFTAQQVLITMLHSVILEDLTERQREALLQVMAYGVPIDDVAQSMGTNRNALYKLLYDARQKVRSAILARGYKPEDVLREL